MQVDIAVCAMSTPDLLRVTNLRKDARLAYAMIHWRVNQ